MTKQEAIAIVQRNVQEQIELFREYFRLTHNGSYTQHCIYLRIWLKAYDYYRINNKLIMKHNIVCVKRKIEVTSIGKYSVQKSFCIPIEQ